LTFCKKHCQKPISSGALSRAPTPTPTLSAHAHHVLCTHNSSQFSRAAHLSGPASGPLPGPGAQLSRCKHNTTHPTATQLHAQQQQLLRWVLRERARSPPHLCAARTACRRARDGSHVRQPLLGVPHAPRGRLCGSHPHVRVALTRFGQRSPHLVAAAAQPSAWRVRHPQRLLVLSPCGAACCCCCFECCGVRARQTALHALQTMLDSQCRPNSHGLTTTDGTLAVLSP
jgi:hypothetical protein